MNDSLIIQNHTLLDHFKQHLDLPDNNDIIFSAPFGTGKTYFLRDDFTEKLKERYNVIHLYPVNYSVASNEDIFELIKYDLLFDLMLKFGEQIENLEDLQIDRGLAIQLYIQNNFKAFDFIQQIFKSTSKLGKNISDVIDILKLEKSKYETFVEELKSNEFDTIKNYLESFDSKRGSLEFDTISVLIKEILNKVKDKKENVLIIDDLDRIDPEHIFRIFNVLSAHRDHITQKNKFGFDKVILVCDIENIKRIYEHRYGRSVDFHGYINKFYSKSIYEFDNRRYIRELLTKYLDHLEYDVFTEEFSHFQLNSRRGDGFYKVFLYLLQIFVEQRKLSLRSLKNITKLSLLQLSFFNKTTQSYDVSVKSYGLLVLTEYMSTLFGSRQAFVDSVRELVESSISFNYYTLKIESYYYNMFLKNLFSMVINIVQMDSMPDEATKLEFAVWNTEMKIEYNVQRYMWSNTAVAIVANEDQTFYHLDIMQFLFNGLKNVESRKLLS